MASNELEDVFAGRDPGAISYVAARHVRAKVVVTVWMGR
jgi:hypothetical protein